MSLLNAIIATNVDEVGISFLDFYSIGHICMGIGIFLFFSLFYTIPMGKNNLSQRIFPLWVIWILTVACGIAWEVLENVILYQMGFKFEGRIDSIPNMVTDVVLVGLAGLFMWFYAHITFRNTKNHVIYYLFGLIGFALWIGLFIIARYLFLI